MKLPNSIIASSLSALLITILVAVTISCSVTEDKTYTIGIVNPNTGLQSVTKGFIEGMMEFGYVEGKNVTYIKKNSKKDMAFDINSMVNKKVDMIFTVTTPATKAATKATKGSNIPVIFGVTFAPEKSGLIKSIKRPGGNVTGIQVSGSTPKALEWLMVIAPNIKNIFVPATYDTKAALLSLADLKKGAKKLGIRLTIAETKTKAALEETLSSIPDDADAIFIINSILIVSNIDKVVETAIKHKLPMGSGTGQYKNGVTISYGQNHYISGKKASRLADQVLNGVSPAELPVEMTEYFLGINLKTTHAMGLSISEEVLQQADFVIR